MIYFRMLYTVEHLPIPVLFSTLLVEVDFKRTTIGVAEHFRDASFPRRAVPENRNTTEVAVCLYMIQLLKTNYQQKKKKGNIPRQQKGNQVYQSCS